MSCIPVHRNGLYELYSTLLCRGMLVERKPRIDNILNVFNNAASKKISHINSIFGMTRARHYIIKGEVADVKDRVGKNESHSCKVVRHEPEQRKFCTI